MASKKKPPVVEKAFTKTQLLNELAENTGVSKKEVAAVLDELGSVIERHLRKKRGKSESAGSFTLPGLLKIKTVDVPARKAETRPNPFGEGMMQVKARPASRKVKVTPLKKLKEMAL